MKKLKLYHGTNSIFLESIEQNGLGGINLVEQTNVLPLVKELNDLATSELESEYKDYGWGILRMTISFICDQSAGSRMNWQHGDVYLSPSVNRAMSFAVENKYGSELFTNLNYLIDFIDKHTDAKAQVILTKYPAVKEILNKEGRPIVLELPNLTPADLLDEGGYTADAFYQETLHYLKTLSEEEKNEKDNPLDIIGFRLKYPVPLERIIVHEVRVNK
jgi:hypothetical protein